MPQDPDKEGQVKSIARILGAAAFKAKGAWTRALVSILNEVHVKMERGDLTADKASGREDVPPVVAEHDGHGTAAASTAVGMNAFVATASCAEATTLSELSSSAEQPEWNVNDKVVTASLQGQARQQIGCGPEGSLEEVACEASGRRGLRKIL